MTNKKRLKLADKVQKRIQVNAETKPGIYATMCANYAQKVRKRK